jgi:uncharacterized membrane protein
MSARFPWRLFPLTALALLCLGHGGCEEDKDAHAHDHSHEGRASGATCPEEGGPTARDFGRAFLESYCLSCHSASVTGPARGGAPEEVNFDSLEEVRRQAETIDTHCAAGPSASNSAMPPSSSPHQPTQEERLKLGQWLACGAP